MIVNMYLSLRTRRKLPGAFAPGLEVNSKLFAVSHDAKHVFSGGHWDNSLRAYSIVRAKQVAHIVRHTGKHIVGHAYKHSVRHNK